MPLFATVFESKRNVHSRDSVFTLALASFPLQSSIQKLKFGNTKRVKL